jgi:hypothetical protein
VCPDPHCEWCVGILCRAITEAPLCSNLDIHPPAPTCSPNHPSTSRQLTLSCVRMHMHTPQLHCDWRRGTRVGSALQPCCHARCVPFGQNGFAHDALRMCATVGVSLQNAFDQSYTAARMHTFITASVCVERCQSNFARCGFVVCLRIHAVHHHGKCIHFNDDAHFEFIPPAQRESASAHSRSQWNHSRAPCVHTPEPDLRILFAHRLTTYPVCRNAGMSSRNLWVASRVLGSHEVS